ncbi:hypothetical protein [Lentzea cavernae]|uniref:Secreted protein n=1 Tax=Lentzea cavernae TaxID=2020703 RepID=A0ABQ3LZI4_9PSEU|nr:hypothetical protein [Lentzea cavernae]GHH30125.1 hypothetical protein GCM10017774_07260 [Lentzea cavernae]
MRKILAAGAVVAAALSTTAGIAQAESSPTCSSVTQIGSTAYATSGGTTVASVKQFKGCGKNFSYVYVWDSWISSHSRDFTLRTYVQTRPNNSNGYKTGARGQQELWSGGADTLDQCTRAHGEVDGSSYFTFAKTSERC